MLGNSLLVLMLQSITASLVPDWQIAAAGVESAHLEITVISLDELGFLHTKPSLLTNSSSDVHIAVVTHNESALPFGQSLAVKMKSREAVTAALTGTPEPQNVTCAQLNQMSLQTALRLLNATERSWYGMRTPVLVFAADQQLHTGLWDFAKLTISQNTNGSIVKVVSPCFHQPDYKLPALLVWTECSIALLEWVRSQLSER